jgi:hypothetical protein
MGLYACNAQAGGWPGYEEPGVNFSPVFKAGPFLSLPFDFCCLWLD